MIIVTIFLIPTFILALIIALLIIASTGTFSSGPDDQDDRSITKTDQFLPPGELLPPAL